MAKETGILKGERSVCGQEPILFPYMASCMLRAPMAHVDFRMLRPKDIVSQQKKKMPFSLCEL